MNRAIRFAVRSCAMIAVATAVPSFAQQVTFAYHFEPGTSERYSVKFNQDVDMMGGKMTVSNLADMEVTVTCVAAKDGKFSMQMKFDKVDVSTTMQGTPSASPLGEQIMGQSIMFTANANGDVTDVTPVGSFDAWASAQTLVRPVVESWYPHLPDKAVAVGGTWEKAGEKRKVESGTETITNAAFKFREMKKEKGRDLAVVEQTLDTSVGGTTTTPMGVYTVAGFGKGKGDFSFDPAKSCVVKIKGKVDITMDMTPQSGGEPVRTVMSNHLERTLLE